MKKLTFALCFTMSFALATFAQSNPDFDGVDNSKEVDRIIRESGTVQGKYPTLFKNKADISALDEAPRSSSIINGSDRDVLASKDIVYGRPYSFDTYLSESDLQAIGLTAAATAIVFANDRDLTDFVQKADGKVLDRAASFGEAFGNPRNAALLAGTSMVYAILVNDKNIKEVVPVQVKALVTVAILNQALKMAFHRALPSETRDPYARTKSNKAADMAFPSGHTTAAFAAATIIAENTGGIIPILAYTAAGITAWSRVHDNQHWVSDLGASIILGHYVTKALITKTKSGNRIQFIPYYSHNGFGVQVNYQPRSAHVPCGRGHEGLGRVSACIIEATTKK